MVSSARSGSRSPGALGRSTARPAFRGRAAAGRGSGPGADRGGPRFFLAEYGREPMDARELAGQIAKDSRPRTQTVAGMT